MAKKKEASKINVFKIFLEGIILYLKNLNKFLLYMAFPVLGQVLSMILIFTTVHLFSNNVEKIIAINPALNNVPIMLIIMLVLTIPSFMIFFAAFWKYLVALGALNSMANNLISGAKLEDLSIHNDTVNRRMPTFLGILFIISVISFMGIFPPLWALILILMIYLSLTFQVFALEENLNAIEVIKKSFKMVKGNFMKITLLLILLTILTYDLIPNIFIFSCERFNLLQHLCIPIEIFSKNLPLEEIQTTIQSVLSSINTNANFVLNEKIFARNVLENTISGIIIGFTLPLRSLCCTLLYKNIEIKKLKEKKLKEL